MKDFEASHLLYVATADLMIGDARLESRGVVPDMVAPFDSAFAAGADPWVGRWSDRCH